MAEVTGGTRIMGVVKGYVDRIDSAHEVRVGFLEKGAPEPDGTPVAAVAAINNFGAPGAGIPPRPFFTNMVAEHGGDWGNQFAEIMKANDCDSATALDQLGTLMAGQLREAIAQMQSPPLSPVTLLLRERFWTNPQDIKFSDVHQARQDIASGKVPNVTSSQSTPLVWTGRMLRNADWEVE